MTEGFSGFARVLKSCHRENHTLIFCEDPILSMVIIHFLCCFPYMKPWVAFSNCLDG